MRDLFLLANEVQSFCRVRGWRFCFIGGIALQRWGEPRLTGDVDLTLLTGFGDEAGYVDELCGAFGGHIPDAAEFAPRNRVLLLQSMLHPGEDRSMSFSSRRPAGFGPVRPAGFNPA